MERITPREDCSMLDDDDKKDEDSVWTSYADLFTTVAVIFLVMFVFALIKAGVSKMQSVVEKREHENELKGKVSSKVKKQTDKKIEKVTKSIKEMDQYEDLITQKMKDMNKFVKDLKKNRQVMHQLIKDQLRKEAMLNTVNEKITKLEINLKVEKKENRSLAKEIKENIEQITKIKKQKTIISKKKNLIVKKLEEKKQELLKEIKEKETVTSKLMNQLKVNEKIVKVGLKDKKQITQIKSKLVDKTDESKALNVRLKSQTEQTVEMKKTYKHFIKQKNNEIKDLSHTIKSLNKNLENKTKTLVQKNSKLKENNQQIHSQNIEITDLVKAKTSQARSLDSLKSKLSTVKAQRNTHISSGKSLRKLKQELEKKQLKLEAELSKQMEISRSISSQRDSMTKNFQKEVAKNNSANDKIKVLTRSLATSKKSDTFHKSEVKKYVGRNDALTGTISKQRDKISNQNKSLERLKQGLAQSESLNGKLDSQLGKEQGKNQGLRNQNKKQSSKLSQLTVTNGSLGSELANGKRKNKNLKAKLDSAMGLNSKLIGNNANRETEINVLKKGSGVLKKSLASAENAIRKLSRANIALAAENSKIGIFKNKLNGQMASLENDNKRLQIDWKDMNSRDVASTTQVKHCKVSKSKIQKRVFHLETKLAGNAKITHGNLNNLKGTVSVLNKENKNLNKENKHLSKRNIKLKDTLQDFATKVVAVKDQLRGSIAKNLAREFKKANLNVLVDEKTGNVVLLMNEDFRFKKNSFNLNKIAKTTLKKIIPIYSKVLFGSKTIGEKIQSFNIIGHASPSFKGKFVEPLSNNNVAYSYNMRLSAQRAASITNYIFGRHVGEYQFKKRLKSFTSAIGQGFTKPVRAMRVGRSLASTEKSKCGPYDCYGSQRVELSFTLREDINSLNKIINMAKGVK